MGCIKVSIIFTLVILSALQTLHYMNNSVVKAGEAVSGSLVNNKYIFH